MVMTKDKEKLKSLGRRDQRKEDWIYKEREEGEVEVEEHTKMKAKSYNIDFQVMNVLLQKQDHHINEEA